MNNKQKEDFLDIEDTADDTRLSDIENIIVFSSSKSKTTNHNLFPNINNLIGQTERLSENNILQQRENRHKISLIKKVIQKKEDVNKTKIKIKEILNTYNNNIIFLKDDQRNTLLHIYINLKDPDALKIIIDIYIDILGISEYFYIFLFMKNIKGFTAFDLGVKFCNIPIIKLLYEQLEKCQDKIKIITYMEYLRNNIFNISAENNKIYPIIFFYEKFRKFYINKKIKLLDCKEEGINKQGMTPILYASKNGNLKLLLILIDLGADINSINDLGYTPLHYAVKNNDKRMVKHLLIRGANKFISDNNNMTPFDLAVSLRNENIIKILYHKNCCQNIFCGGELGKLSGKISMIIMILYLILSTFFKIVIFVRFFFVMNGININSLLSIDLNNNPEKIELNELLTCFDDNCVSIIFLLLLCLFINLSFLLYFIIFKCSKNVFLPKKKNVEERLSKLYETNENVCLKCGIFKKADTKHCLICDRCVDNWDHHCYWLNTCINNKNFCKFKLFLYFSFVLLFSNLLFYIYSVYLLLSAKDLFFKEIINIEIDSFVYYLVIIFLVSIEIVLILITAYILIFINFPLIIYNCKNNISKQKLEEKVESLIDSEDSFNKVFEEKILDLKK